LKTLFFEKQSENESMEMKIAMGGKTK